MRWKITVLPVPESFQDHRDQLTLADDKNNIVQHFWCHCSFDDGAVKLHLAEDNQSNCWLKAASTKLRKLHLFIAITSPKLGGPWNMKEGDTFDSSCLTWGYWKIIYQQLDTCYVASFPFIIHSVIKRCENHDTLVVKFLNYSKIWSRI